MDPSYGKAYAELYRRHWWWRAREKFVLEQLRRWRQPDDKRAILDVGCGDALLFPRLETFGPVYGIEPDASLVRPDNPYRAQIHLGSLGPGYAPAASVSTVLMLDVLEHMPDAVDSLRIVHSILARDGTLLITVPALMALWTSHDVLNHHVTRYSPRTLRATLTKAGFRVAHLRFFFRWVAVGKLATQALESITRAEPSPPRVPPPAINALCYAASRAEELVLAAFLPATALLPGSSLLVVAKPA